MKKTFLAAVALMCSSVVFAQVDSTSQSTPSTDYSKSGTQTDTVSQSSTQTDTTTQTGTQTDTLSNQGSGSSTAPAGDSTTTGSTQPMDPKSLTDDDIHRYAVVMDSVESMKSQLLEKITAKVKSNPKMKVARYIELSKAQNDEAKLAELKATPDEIAFVKEVSDFKNEGATQISDKFQSLVKDYVGTDIYNAIKGRLTYDSEFKAKYDQELANVSSARESATSSAAGKTSTSKTSTSKTTTSKSSTSTSTSTSGAGSASGGSASK